MRAKVLSLAIELNDGVQKNPEERRRVNRELSLIRS